MTAILLLSPVAVVLVGLLGFIAFESSAARRDRDGLLKLNPEAASQHAAANVVRARSQFSQAVEAYELGLALAEQSTVRTSAQQLVGVGDARTGGGGDTFFGTSDVVSGAGASVPELEYAKEVARTQLLDAQRLWESVRPSPGPDSEIDLWFGHGVMRGWHLGPIGFERGFVRVEHVLDPTCWAAYEVSRMRWGVAVGIENQRVATFSAAVPIERVPEIVSQGMGGGEMALRPGFSPQRWWRRRNRLPAPRRATSALMQTPDLAEGPDDPTRAAIQRAFEIEMGESPTELRSLGEMEGVMSVLAGGPSVMLGAWWGPDPEPHLLAGSPHTSWRRD